MNNAYIQAERIGKKYCEMLDVEFISVELGKRDYWNHSKINYKSEFGEFSVTLQLAWQSVATHENTLR